LAINVQPMDQDLFTEFMSKYNKVYTTEEEFQLRFKNFKASLERIAQKNAATAKNGVGATYGITKFSDMTPEEFRGHMLMSNPIAESDHTDILKPKEGVTAGTQLDWRTQGAVTPVKNQKQCGSCWAFSVTENVESMWILAGKGTNKTVDLSPQQIVDCDKSDGGCNGGNPPTAYKYLIEAGGQESESDYPYTARDGSCKFAKSEVVAKISNWKYATTREDEDTLQANLVSSGPLSICLDAANWQDYTKGVMTKYECALVVTLDHCVQLVGYNLAASVPYYIVRNSWGADWGQAGYIWLQTGANTCGLTNEATSSVV